MKKENHKGPLTFDAIVKSFPQCANTIPTCMVLNVDLFKDVLRGLGVPEEEINEAILNAKSK